MSRKIENLNRYIEESLQPWAESITERIGELSKVHDSISGDNSYETGHGDQA